MVVLEGSTGRGEFKFGAKNETLKGSTGKEHFEFGAKNETLKESTGKEDFKFGAKSETWRGRFKRDENVDVTSGRLFRTNELIVSMTA